MSRVTAVMNGVTMIARMTPAVSMLYPVGAPLEQRPKIWQRRDLLMGVITSADSQGIRMKMPHRP